MATTTSTATDASSVTLKPVKQFVEIFRKDYKPPEFDIENVFMTFKLHETETKVTSELLMRRRPNTGPGNLVLHGDELVCNFISVDGLELSNTPMSGYSLDIDGNMTIPASFLPKDDSKTFTVKTVVTINPKDNLKLCGLYKSSKMFCTQCEPHGFRRITFFLDRPDVLSSYKVRIEADKALYPVLLSNGNKVAAGELGESHFAEFVDPFPKPSYLFALVAGNLSSISSTYRTMSGRDVLVQISAEPEDCGKLHWALESVLKSMKWDEEAYGREYDLDVFHVVSVRDFNMGAMENKGLNIFNTALLLADVNTTTDAEFVRIMSVVGHEYFHNWTGNRVTCRDWFQLTLKEGLTVFREAEFCGTVSSKLSNRIKDVQYLMAVQFAEDSGPMAHPIRPESYISMDNFYTSTVYDKGSFVIGMYKTLLGEEGFRKGMDLYFKRHDLCAVTCDDFRAAMADANGRDFTQFERWYAQSGTPVVEVLSAGLTADGFKVHLKQSTPPTPRQEFKLPFHIPIKVGLIGRVSKKDVLDGSTVLELVEDEQEFIIPGVKEDCVLSINRDFSAPIKVKFEQSEQDLTFLMQYDSDGLNRWDASQRLSTKFILARATGNLDAPIGETYLDAFKSLLESDMEQSEKALCLALPDTEILASKMSPYDPGLLHKALRSIKVELSKKFYPQLLELYKKLTLAPGAKDTLDKEDMARRSLRNTLLSYLVASRDAEAVKLATEHYKSAKTMTDKYSSFIQLMHMTFDGKQDIVDDFYAFANGDAQVVDKWFKAQALSEAEDSLERVKALCSHKDFTMSNPNRFNSLVTVFTYSINFHDISGAGYKFLADLIIEVDKINPQVSARCCNKLLKYSIFDNVRKELMKSHLQRVFNTPGISPNLYEIAQKGLEFTS
ncbi:alpha-aminoacylpeptide hydrolase aminopeptidase, putative [Theileria equi strain WA]|uniref:Alpha-aminoacylpeptide hydrolase aminopeptidase, putative n=1 Tax=Theileria equi strain WA TaxID=1537102 RepID=L0AX87_THEEQ|nr:alpha-aminoacylpeptide hydrolase aminopeptidase, putative [Theileria equi strain WA]AFZ80197.1 alpha-aminoacylpeptide hydrolase aminopeptidase, putative [Theileria equi strain WA]|eukprot:XP_004829863.1 alpha-aminoacylpeptide hydrolase aminopeptidase, putative [Theileria equi strain WA]